MSVQPSKLNIPLIDHNRHMHRSYREVENISQYAGMKDLLSRVEHEIDTKLKTTNFDTNRSNDAAYLLITVDVTSSIDEVESLNKYLIGNATVSKFFKDHLIRSYLEAGWSKMTISIMPGTKKSTKRNMSISLYK